MNLIYLIPTVSSCTTINPILQKNRDPILSVKKIVELYLQIRSESGFTGEDVPTRQLVSLFITDINDPNYDAIFDKRGYLK
jgi:hypothetical protein